jgi:hypothetical protein
LRDIFLLRRLVITFCFPNLVSHSSLGKLHSIEHDMGRRHKLFQNPIAVLEGYIGKINPSQIGREKTSKYVAGSTEIFPYQTESTHALEDLEH